MEIIMLSFLFTLTQQALYKTVLGRDSWTHWALISQILKMGHIPNYETIKTPYVWLPNFHTFITTLMLICSMTYKWMSYFSIGMTTLILEVVITYKLGQYVFKDSKLSLFSILLLVISDNVLSMVGRNIIPNSIGVAIALLVFYLLLRSELTTKINFMLAFFIINLSLLHTVSYVFMITQTLFILLVNMHNMSANQRTEIINRLFVLMWTVAILVWGFISGFYLNVFILFIRKLLMGPDISGYESSLSIPFKFILLGRAGMILYFILAGIGILWYSYFRFKKKSLSRIQLTLLGNSGFFVGFGALTFLIWPGIAHRFWYYGEILGSFFVAYVFYKVITGSRKVGKIVTLTLIFLLSWLMLVASVSNDDNPLVKAYAIRTGWLDSELQTGKFLLRNANDTSVASDWDYIVDLNNLKWVFEGISFTPPRYGDIGWIIKAEFPKSFSEVFENSEYIFIFRKNLVQDRLFELGPYWGRRQHLPLEQEVFNILKEGYWIKDTIYTTKSVIVWY
ncbi:hypothetical protein [Thermococcus sp. GR6]|uniref:hypothetical protein n=1 Tax=Thermococcus sp. GR6 TaxID=1638256 RepID=UPI0014315616|nr:hypothetical protein [Thermococcus sp. GR6]NJE42906.1 hypothetical protein [Thermococcus sp. GR6]